MEYGFQDVERKFHNSVIRVKHMRSNTDVTYRFIYVRGFSEYDDGAIKVEYHHGPSYQQTGAAAYSCVTTPTVRYPRVEFEYWQPDSGIYYGIDGHVYIIRRRVRRSYKVGFHSDAYMIGLLLNGQIVSAGHVTSIDFTRDRVFQDPKILNEYLYVSNGFICFGNYKIGAMSSNGNVLLNNEVFSHFLPESLRARCIANP